MTVRSNIKTLSNVKSFIGTHKCSHCKKRFLAEEVIVTIEMNIASGCRIFERTLDGYDELHFHQECFLEIAGKEFMPEETKLTKKKRIRGAAI